MNTLNTRLTSACPSTPAQPVRRIFLTGASGYIGRNLIRHFCAMGVEVVALVRSAAARDTVAGLGAVPFDGDLLTSALEPGMADCDALIHAAADTDHGLGGAAQHNTNVEGTRRVLAAARAAGIGRVIHLSTESVLLDGKPLVGAKESQPYPARFVGGYSASKAEAEQLALAANAANFSVLVVRPRFVWGRDDSTALPQLVAAVQRKQFAWIDGGHYLTSTTHIANLVHGLGLALVHGQAGQIYFITDGAPVEFRGFITRLLATQGIAQPSKTVPGWMLRSLAAAGEQWARWSRGRLQPIVTRQSLATSAVEVTLDISKAQSQLHYEPVFSIDQGLAELALAHSSR